MDRRTGGIIGTVASIVAAILILYVLVEIYYSGIDSIFEPPVVYAMIALIASGVFALIGYWYYTVEAAWHMRHLSPVALLLGALGVAAGYYYGPVLGGSLIVLAYIVELFVGVKLYRDFLRESRMGALLFLVGVVVFMVFLPVILVAPAASLVSAAGDAVKTLGLIIVLWRMIR